MKREKKEDQTEGCALLKFDIEFEAEEKGPDDENIHIVKHEPLLNGGLTHAKGQKLSYIVFQLMPSSTIKYMTPPTRITSKLWVRSGTYQETLTLLDIANY